MEKLSPNMSYLIGFIHTGKLKEKWYKTTQLKKSNIKPGLYDKEDTLRHRILILHKFSFLFRKAKMLYSENLTFDIMHRGIPSLPVQKHPPAHRLVPG